MSFEFCNIFKRQEDNNKFIDFINKCDGTDALYDYLIPEPILEQMFNKPSSIKASNIFNKLHTDFNITRNVIDAVRKSNDVFKNISDNTMIPIALAEKFVRSPEFGLTSKQLNEFKAYPIEQCGIKEDRIEAMQIIIRQFYMIRHRMLTLITENNASIYPNLITKVPNMHTARKIINGLIANDKSDPAVTTIKHNAKIQYEDPNEIYRDINYLDADFTMDLFPQYVFNAPERYGNPRCNYLITNIGPTDNHVRNVLNDIKNNMHLTGGGNILEEEICDYLMGNTQLEIGFTSEIVVYAFISTILCNKRKLDNYFFDFDDTFIVNLFKLTKIPVLLVKLIEITYILTAKRYYPRHIIFILSEGNKSSGNCLWHAIAHSCLFSDINPSAPFYFLFNEISKLNPDRRNDVFICNLKLYDRFQVLSCIGGIFTTLMYDDLDIKGSKDNNGCIKYNLFDPGISEIVTNVLINYIKEPRRTPNYNTVCPAILARITNIDKIVLSYTDARILIIDHIELDPNAIHKDGLISSRMPIVNSNESLIHAQCIVRSPVDGERIWNRALQTGAKRNRSWTKSSFYDNIIWSDNGILDADTSATYSIIYNLMMLELRDKAGNRLYDVSNKTLYYKSLLYLFEMANEYGYKKLIKLNNINKIPQNVLDDYFDLNNKASSLNALAQESEMKYRQDMVENASILKDFMPTPLDIALIHTVPVDTDYVVILYDPNYVHMYSSASIFRFLIFNDEPVLSLKFPCAPWELMIYHKKYDIWEGPNNYLRSPEDLIPVHNGTPSTPKDKDDTYLIRYMRYVIYNISATPLDLTDPFGANVTSSNIIPLFADNGSYSKTEDMYTHAINEINKRIVKYNEHPIKRMYFKWQLNLLVEFKEHLALLSSLNFNGFLKEYISPVTLNNLGMNIIKGGSNNEILSSLMKIVLCIIYAIVIIAIIASIVYLFTQTLSQIRSSE